MKKLNVFDPNDLKEFEPDAKVGLIATVSEGELPPITLITALQARSTTELIWGQFSEGMSKRNVRKNPRVGFLIMSLSKELWRGKAVWKKALNASLASGLRRRAPNSSLSMAMVSSAACERARRIRRLLSRTAPG
ncbi:MAG TPA: hypothetical protein PLE73_12205, partial [Spirochaetota bacterium]|nr:hypothetical protein [Spirochaetota bacterium]